MTLFEALRDDPESLGLAVLIAAKNDTAVAEAMNSHMVPVLGRVDVADMANWAANTGMRAVIQDLSVDNTSPLRASALSILDVLRNTNGFIDLSKPGNSGLLSAWQGLGKLSAPDAASMVAAATHQTPYSVTVFGRLLTANDVSRVVRDDAGNPLI